MPRSRPRRWRAWGPRLIAVSFVLSLAVWLAGCGGLVARKPEAQWISQPPPGRALVFVLYPLDESAHRSTPLAPVFLEVGRGDRYLASLAPGMHVAVALEPGDYLFAVVGQIPDLMGARVRAGETYHAAIRARRGESGDPFGMGAHGSFALEPINDPADPRLAGWLADSSEVEPTERARRRSRSDRQRLEQLKPIYRPKWAAQEEPAYLDVPTPHAAAE